MAQKANKKQIIPVVIIIAITSLIGILGLLLAVTFPFISYLTAKVEITDNIENTWHRNIANIVLYVNWERYPF